MKDAWEVWVFLHGRTNFRDVYTMQLSVVKVRCSFVVHTVYYESVVHSTEREKGSCSVMPDSLRPHGKWPAPSSSIHGIFQARILEWVAVSFSRESSQPRDRSQVSHTVGRRFTVGATGEFPILNRSRSHLKFRSHCSYLSTSCFRH